MSESYQPPQWPQKPSKDLPLPLAMRPAVAARAIGICERTLWTLTQRGEVPHTRIGGTVIYPTAAIMRWLEEQTVNPPVKRPEPPEPPLNLLTGSTKVIHWRDREQHPESVYVGRALPRHSIPGSPFANPFKIGRDGSRADVIAKYAAWLSAQPELMEQARGLRGKVLVCWCAPEPCHADVLAHVAEGGAV